MSRSSNGLRFVNPIPFVKDIARSKQFYSKVLGLSVIEDHGNFVLFETGFALHEGTSLVQTVWGKREEIGETYGRRNLLLYFEVEDLEAAFARIGPQVELIHGPERQDWGQTVFRFLDPDGHAIEIGAPQTK